MASGRLGYIMVEPGVSDGSRAAYYGIARLDSGQLIPKDPSCPAQAVWWRYEAAGMAEREDLWLFIATREGALQARSGYAQLGYDLDVIEVHQCDDAEYFESVAASPGFLGADIGTLSGHSALHPNRIRRDCGEGPPGLDSIEKLTRRYIEPKLNRYGLLNGYDDAVLLRDVTAVVVRTWREAVIFLENAVVLGIIHVAPTRADLPIGS